MQTNNQSVDELERQTIREERRVVKNKPFPQQGEPILGKGKVALVWRC